MGQAQSSNFAKVVSETYLKSAQTTSQNSNVNSTASAIIAVSGTKGDVTISGVSINQKVEAKAKAVFQAMNDSSIVQQISTELAQKSMSFLSGLPLGSTDAQNTIEAYSNSAISINQDISTTCSTSASALFAIDVSNTGGNVLIKDINVGQDVSSFQDCISSTTNKLVSQQTIKTDIDQAAESKVVGVNFGLFMLLPILIVGGCILILAIVASKLNLHPLVILIIVLLIVIGISIYEISSKIPSSLKTERAKLVKIENQIQALKSLPPKDPDEITTIWGSVGIKNLPCGAQQTTPPNQTASPTLSGGINGCFFKIYNDAPVFTDIDAMTSWFSKSGDNIAAMDILFKNNQQPYCVVYDEIKTPSLCQVALSSCASPITTPLYCNILPTVIEANISNAQKGSNQLIFTTNGKLFRRSADNTQWLLVRDNIWTGTASQSSIIIRTSPPSPDETPSTLIVSGTLSPGPYYYIDASIPPSGSLNGMDVYKWVKKQDSLTFDATNGIWSLLTTIDMTALTNEEVIPFRLNPAFTENLSQMSRTILYIPNEEVKKARAEKLISLQSSRDSIVSGIRNLKIFNGVCIALIPVSIIGIIISSFQLRKASTVAPDSDSLNTVLNTMSTVANTISSHVPNRLSSTPSPDPVVSH